jgi:hypothetical protein
MRRTEARASLCGTAANNQKNRFFTTPIPIFS